MEFKNKVKALAEGFLEQREDLFSAELKVSPKNDIVLVLDGDRGVTLQDCLDASRFIENGLDRDAEDFSLTVTSYGADEPLKSARQFRKNTGREMEILLNSGEETTGELIAADDEKIQILRKFRRAKLTGKGKENVEEIKDFFYSDIKKATVVIKI